MRTEKSEARWEGAPADKAGRRPASIGPLNRRTSGWTTDQKLDDFDPQQTKRTVFVDTE